MAETKTKEERGDNPLVWPEVRALIGHPFEPRDYEWKVQKITQKGKAICVCYVEVRAVMDRLDDMAELIAGMGRPDLSIWGSRLRVVSSNTVILEFDGFGTHREVPGLDQRGRYSDKSDKSDKSDEGDLLGADTRAYWRLISNLGPGRYMYREVPSVLTEYDERYKRIAEEIDITRVAPWLFDPDVPVPDPVPQMVFPSGKPLGEKPASGGNGHGDGRKKAEEPAKKKAGAAGGGQEKKERPGKHTPGDVARPGCTTKKSLIAWAISQYAQALGVEVETAKEHVSSALSYTDGDVSKAVDLMMRKLAEAAGESKAA